eukprot:500244_1
MTSLQDSKKYPHIGDIVELHSLIKNSHSSQIQKLTDFNRNTLKQILLIYVEFFFNSFNRDKYLNMNDSKLSIHSTIFHLLTNNKPKHKKMHITILIPTSLLSYCISFLTQKDRAHAAKVNVKWFKASCSPTAKYHLKITNAFINKEMIKTPAKFKYDSVGCLELKQNIKCRHREALNINYHKN